MVQSTDINLPRRHLAQFPDRCVICGNSSPGSHVRIVTGSLGWWTWMLWWFGKPFVVKAPACSWCGWKLHGLRLASLAFTVAITLAALVFVWPLFEDSVPPGVRKWAMMGLVLVCLSPQFIVEVFFAKPFDVTAYADSIDYEFASKAYAAEFATLNRDAEWVKVDGMQHT